MTISEAIEAMKVATKNTFQVECTVMCSKYTRMEPQVEFRVFCHDLRRSCAANTLASAVGAALARLHEQNGPCSNTVAEAEAMMAEADGVASAVVQGSDEKMHDPTRKEQ